MRKIILFSLSVVLSFNLLSQDLIIRKNPSGQIECKIEEIETDLIFYTIFAGNEEKTLSIDKSNVVSIRFENGEVLEFGDPYKVNRIEDGTNNVIKFNFFGPLYGHTYMSYERVLKPNISWEAGLGIIGLGWDINYNKPFGAVVRAGMKFRQHPENRSFSAGYHHYLNGVYIMPELVLSTYKYDSRSYSDVDPALRYHLTNYDNVDVIRRSTLSFAILVTWGKEVVFADRFAIDWFGSIGYGFSNKHNNGLNFAFIGGDTKGVPLAFSGGVKIGILFYDKRQPMLYR